MSAKHGRVRGVSKIVDNGPERKRWDLVIMGDGYRADELAKYQRDVDAIAAAIFRIRPFDRLGGGINIHRVDVESAESGAGDLCQGIDRRTFFGANFCGHRIDRLLVADTAVALDAALDAIPAMNASLLVVNSTTYGGSGGTVPVCSTAPGAFNVALHEMGHSHFGLADEYADPIREGQNRYTGAEPGEPNVTARLAPLKWASSASPGVALPTTSNPDCTQNDRRPSPVAAQTVGAFEGAFYHHCGVYRPQYDCKMRNVEADFCAVCIAAIERVLQPFAPPPPPRRKRRSARS